MTKKSRSTFCGPRELARGGLKRYGIKGLVSERATKRPVFRIKVFFQIAALLSDSPLGWPFFRGIFRADTPEELAQSIKLVEDIGRVRNSSPIPAAPSTKAAHVPYIQPTSPLFRKVADEVLKEIGLTLKAASVYKYKNTYDAFINFVGNRFMEDLTRSNIKRFKDKMLEDGKVPHTVNGHMGRLEAVFDHTIKNQYVTGENPAANHIIPHSKKLTKSRDKFYDDEFKTIFNWDTYKDMASTPDYFLGPLIFLVSGMRIEECTSLKINQIKTDDGILLIHITDAKTPNGVRYVPIHFFLLKLGFMDYVEEVKKLGHESLFLYLSEGPNGKLADHNGTKKNLSRRFSKYLTDLGVKQDTSCFYSLRHTAITRLLALVKNSTIFKLCGHKSDSSTHYDYFTNPQPRQSNRLSRY